MSEIVRSQNDLTADFSIDVKPLQPRNSKEARDIKRKQLKEEIYSEFSLTERIYLKISIFSEFYITDSELQYPLRVLVGNKDNFA